MTEAFTGVDRTRPLGDSRSVNTDLALSLVTLLPGAKYGGVLINNSREEYEALRWEDDRPKPKWEDLPKVEVPAEAAVPTLEDLARRVAALEQKVG